MKILVLGKDGMLGQTVYEYLVRQGRDVIGTTRKDFDVVDYVYGRANIPECDVIINCIGILNHSKNTYMTVLVNSIFPIELEEREDAKLIHISTDCYMDNSVYGHSKWLGEQLSESLVLRTSIIGIDRFKEGTGLWNWFLNQKKECNGYTNHIWYGITTLELAKIINELIESDMTGIKEVSNGIGIQKSELLKLIKEAYKKNIAINETSTDEPVEKKLKNDTGIEINDYKTMVYQMRHFYDED